MNYLKKESFWLNFSPTLISLAIILAALFLFKSLPQKVPLFYSLPWGEKQLAQKQQLLIIPGCIVLINLLNVVISWQLHPQQLFFKRVLILSSLLITLILTITFLKIIFIFI